MTSDENVSLKIPRKHSSLALTGNRPLVDESRVFDENAWDNAVWTEEQEQEAALKVQRHFETATLTVEQRSEIKEQAAANWDKFYSKHEGNFFKDRQWLTVEFPCVKDIVCKNLKASADDSVDILEFGCGVGNTIYPLMEQVHGINGLDIADKQRINFMATDFSSQAIDVLKQHPKYAQYSKHLSTQVLDVSQPLPSEFKTRKFDLIVCIFVLSALHPSSWATVNENIVNILKPGGMVIFRDYGRYDMTQLRFKNHRVLGENFYVRGDGTQVYFFTLDQVQNEIFKGLEPLQNGIDRRLLINRQKKMKMYRVWIQSQFKKS